MKKIGIALLLSLLAFHGAAFAVDPAKAQAELLAAKKAELDQTQWEINVTASGSKEPRPDTLIFKDGKFESKKFSSEGYKPTNITLTLQEGGPTVWETMQSNDSGKAIFWRGEWDGQSMTGIISKQVGDGKSEDYHFGTKSMQKIEAAPEPAKEEAAAPAPAEDENVAADTEESGDVDAADMEENAAPAEEAVAPAPAAQTEQKEEKPKKKGWF